MSGNSFDVLNATRKEDLFYYDGSPPDVSDQVFAFEYQNASTTVDGIDIFTLEVRDTISTTSTEFYALHDGNYFEIHKLMTGTNYGHKFTDISEFGAHYLLRATFTIRAVLNFSHQKETFINLKKAQAILLIFLMETTQLRVFLMNKMTLQGLGLLR